MIFLTDQNKKTVSSSIAYNDFPVIIDSGFIFGEVAHALFIDGTRLPLVPIGCIYKNIDGEIVLCHEEVKEGYSMNEDEEWIDADGNVVTYSEAHIITPTETRYPTQDYPFREVDGGIEVYIEE